MKSPWTGCQVSPSPILPAPNTTFHQEHSAGSHRLWWTFREKFLFRKHNSFLCYIFIRPVKAEANQNLQDWDVVCVFTFFFCTCWAPFTVSEALYRPIKSPFPNTRFYQIILSNSVVSLECKDKLLNVELFIHFDRIIESQPGSFLSPTSQ